MKDKLILITGASSGIGEVTAKLLAKSGAIVILLARGEQNLHRVKSEIEATNGKANYYVVDLSSKEEVVKIAATIKAEVGIPDVIVNNAGAGNWLSILETTNEEFEQMQSTPHLAAFFITKSFIHEMIERGSGHIININSVGAYFSFPGALGYLSSRWALRSFSEALSMEMKDTKVAVSTVVAGKVDSPYFTNNPVSESRIPKIADWLSSTLTMEEVALTIQRTIHTRKKTVIIPISMRTLIYLYRLFPQLFNFLLIKTGHKTMG